MNQPSTTRVVLVNDREQAIQDRRIEAREIEIREVEPGVFSVLRDGNSFQVRIAPDRAGFTVDVLGHRFSTEVRDPRNAKHRSGAALGAGHQTVSASMPGKVIRVLVEPDQEVEAGQGLIVVEAMKMQNEMKAGKPGRVVQVHARTGDTVAAGDVLITIG